MAGVGHQPSFIGFEVFAGKVFVSFLHDILGRSAVSESYSIVAGVIYMGWGRKQEERVTVYSHIRTY